MSALASVGAALLASGCATFSNDGGFGGVDLQTKERIGYSAPALRTAADMAAAAGRVTALLTQPLTADSSVEIALLNSPDLRVRLAELGVAEADLVQAGRLHNPSFSFSRRANSERQGINS